MQYAIFFPSRSPLLPPLSDPRREAFAQAAARGGPIAAAYREAGYAATRSGGARMAAKPPVAERITELKERRERNELACLEETIDQLLKLAKDVGATSAAAAKEARIARLEAHRLWETLASREKSAGVDRPAQRAPTEAEWLARYGHLTRGC